MRYADGILQLINTSDKHFTAEQIFFEMKKTQAGISLATVYNNLNALTEKGLIRRIAVDGQADRYDKIKKHDHLVCKRCGRLADFEFADLTAALERQLHSGISAYDLKVYYECPECRNKKHTGDIYEQ